jgi:hypothetical protein
MNPWWTDQQAGWVGGIGGSVAGILGGLLGTIVGIFAPRGKCRALVYAMITFMISVSALCLIAGIVALFLGQPYGVYYPLLLEGAIGLPVVGGLTPLIRRTYRQADARRLEAEEFRRSS